MRTNAMVHYCHNYCVHNNIIYPINIVGHWVCSCTCTNQATNFNTSSVITRVCVWINSLNLLCNWTPLPLRTATPVFNILYGWGRARLVIMAAMFLGVFLTSREWSGCSGGDGLRLWLLWRCFLLLEGGGLGNSCKWWHSQQIMVQCTSYCLYWSPWEYQ